MFTSILSWLGVHAPSQKHQHGKRFVRSTTNATPGISRDGTVIFYIDADAPEPSPIDEQVSQILTRAESSSTVLAFDRLQPQVDTDISSEDARSTTSTLSSTLSSSSVSLSEVSVFNGELGNRPRRRHISPARGMNGGVYDSEKRELVYLGPTASASSTLRPRTFASTLFEYDVSSCPIFERFDVTGEVVQMINNTQFAARQPVDEIRGRSMPLTLYKPRGKWAWTADSVIHEITHISTISDEAKMSLKHGRIDADHLLYIDKSFTDEDDGFFSELALFRSHLRDLQGTSVLCTISACRRPFSSSSSIVFEPPHRSFWIYASPWMSESLKRRTIEAFEAIHSRGVLHNDICLENIWIDGDCIVKLVNFERARVREDKTIEGIALDIVKAEKWLDERENEMKKVRKLLGMERDYEEDEYEDEGTKSTFHIMPGQSQDEFKREVRLFSDILEDLSHGTTSWDALRFTSAVQGTSSSRSSSLKRNPTFTGRLSSKPSRQNISDGSRTLTFGPDSWPFVASGDTEVASTSSERSDEDVVDANIRRRRLAKGKGRAVATDEEGRGKRKRDEEDGGESDKDGDEMRRGDGWLPKVQIVRRDHGGDGWLEPGFVM